MDKYCLVIGGNSGIGHATANVLRNRGFDLACPDHFKLDITDIGRVRRFLSVHGPFTHIVYSAGVNVLRWIKDYPKSSPLDYVFNVNVAGFINVISAQVDIWPDWQASAVAVSSDAGDIPMRGSLAYCTSKAALNMAVRVMARELAPLWRVNAVAPGMVDGTPMTEYIDHNIPEFRGWSEEYTREYERSSVPSGRRATLDEVAETISWVLTGPGQMTGAIIRINGGKS